MKKILFALIASLMFTMGLFAKDAINDIDLEKAAKILGLEQYEFEILAANEVPEIDSLVRIDYRLIGDPLIRFYYYDLRTSNYFRGSFYGPDGTNISERDIKTINAKFFSLLNSMDALKRREAEQMLSRASMVRSIKFVNTFKEVSRTLAGKNPDGETYYFYSDLLCSSCKKAHKENLPQIINKAKNVVLVPSPLFEESPERSMLFLDLSRNAKNNDAILDAWHKAQEMDFEQIQKYIDDNAKRMKPTVDLIERLILKHRPDIEKVGVPALYTVDGAIVNHEKFK